MLITTQPRLPGLVEQRLGEGADLAVRQARGRAVGVFALLVVVQDQHAQPLAGAGRGPLQHLPVAGRVAERRLRPLAGEQVDVLGLAGEVVVQLQLRLADQLGLALGVVLVAGLE